MQGKQDTDTNLIYDFVTTFEPCDWCSAERGEPIKFCKFVLLNGFWCHQSMHNSFVQFENGYKRTGEMSAVVLIDCLRLWLDLMIGWENDWIRDRWLSEKTTD